MKLQERLLHNHPTRTRGRRSRALALLLGLVGVLSGGGCGSSSTDAGQVPIDTGSGYVADYDVVGGSAAESALLSETVVKTRPPWLDKVELGPVPAGAVPEGAEADTVPGTKWLTFEYSVPDEEGATVEAFWRGAIAATGYRRAAEEQGLPLVRGYTVRSRTADGEIVQDETLPISATGYEWDGTVPATDIEPLRARLSNESSPTVRVLSLEVAEPGGAAPAITLEVSDARAVFEDRDALRFVGGLGIYEGSLIRLVDTKGGLVQISASAHRASAGMKWTRPEFGEYVNP